MNAANCESRHCQEFNLRSLRKQPGFTLVELLVVITILSVLAALLMPALRSAQASAQQVGCASNLHQVGVALASYNDDWNGYEIPNLVAAWSDSSVPWYKKIWHEYLGFDYLDMTRQPWSRNNVFVCPTLAPDFDLMGGAASWKYCYVYAPSKPLYSTAGINTIRAGKRLSSNPYAPSKVARIAPNACSVNGWNTGNAYYDIAYPHSGGCNILFFDNHIKRVRGLLPILEDPDPDRKKEAKIFWGWTP